MGHSVSASNITMSNITLVVLTALLAIVSAKSVTKETVTIDWKVPMDPVEMCVTPGTDVVFKWVDGHNVDTVGSQEDYDTCKGFTDTTPVAGPYTWTAPAPATGTPVWVVCGVSKHCQYGPPWLNSLVAYRGPSEAHHSLSEAHWSP